MYTYVKAVCLATGPGNQFVEVDLRLTAVTTIFNTYSKVFLELGNIYLTQHIYVDFNVLKSEFGGYTGTLNDLLTTLGNRTILNVSALPTTTVKYARYADAWSAGYKIDTFKIGSLDQGPTINKTDAIITRPHFSTRLQDLHDYSLVSVNGFYHMTDTDGTNAYIYDAAKTLKKSNKNSVGILSFFDIGKVTKVRINPSDVFGQGVGDMRERTYIKLNQDTTNKTVLLVLGGYLMFPESNEFFRAGDQLFGINFSSIPLLERYFESSPYLDLTGLGLDINTVSNSIVNIDQFYSDAVLTNYLTMSQSFFVIIDTPNLFTNQLFIKTSNIPGGFTSYQEPTYPLVVNYGRAVDYWKVYEDGYWSVSAQDTHLKNYVFTYRNINGINNVVPATVPSDTPNNARAFLLEIGSY